MTKITIVTTLLVATALGSSQGLAEIVVGPGFGTACAEGSCPVFGNSVNAVGAHSLDFFQSSTGPVDTGTLLLIFAVPNNPANALPANPVTGAQLHVPAANSSSTAVAVESLSSPVEMTGREVYGTLGLFDGDVVAFRDLQAADYALFPAIYNPSTNPINNFSLYEIPLMTIGGEVFGSGDLINVDFTSLPRGTFALGYATPSLTVTDTSFTEAGVSGLAVVPEPASWALLGSALGCLGWWRQKRI